MESQPPPSSEVKGKVGRRHRMSFVGGIDVDAASFIALTTNVTGGKAFGFDTKVLFLQETHIYYKTEFVEDVRMLTRCP